jgi:hypothetical protein
MPGAKLAESIKMAEKCLNLGRILWFLPCCRAGFPPLRKGQKQQSVNARKRIVPIFEW